MMKETSNNPYSEEWAKQINEKTKDELLQIMASTADHDPAFVALAQERLASEFHIHVKPTPAQPKESSFGYRHLIGEFAGEVLNWGWLLVAAVFFVLLTLVAFQQAVAKLSFWQYLDAAWFFLLAYASAAISFALLWGKFSAFRKRLKERDASTNVPLGQTATVPVHGEAASVSATAGTSEQPLSRNLLKQTLSNIGCQYEEDPERPDWLHFAYQGEHFIAYASNTCPFVDLGDFTWASANMEDIDKIARVRKAINNANWQSDVPILYSINKTENTMDVHCKKRILFISQIPDIEDYLRSELDRFFKAHNLFLTEMDQLQKQEEAREEQQA